MTRRPLISTLFPYTTLFRSHQSQPRQHQQNNRLITRADRQGRPGPAQGRLNANERTGRQAKYERVGAPAVDRLGARSPRSEEHTSELQSLAYLVCRLLLEKK